VGVVYFVVQNTKPFISASRNRDYQSQRYLMNGICRRFGISKWVLNKNMIGNGIMQLFVNKEFEGSVTEAIGSKGGEFKFDTEFEAGQVPSLSLLTNNCIMPLPIMFLFRTHLLIPNLLHIPFIKYLWDW
jgi:hypothetical protein